MADTSDNDPSALPRLTELRQQAERLRTFVARTEQAKARVHETVYRKVLGEYTERLARVEEEAAAVEGQVRRAYETLVSRRDELTGPYEEAQLALEELELRHVVGEIDDRDWDTQRQGPSDVLERCKAELAALEQTLAQFRLVLEPGVPAVSAPPSVAAAAPPSVATAAPPSVAPAAPPSVVTAKPPTVTPVPPPSVPAAPPPSVAAAARPGPAVAVASQPSSITVDSTSSASVAASTPAAAMPPFSRRSAPSLERREKPVEPPPLERRKEAPIQPGPRVPAPAPDRIDLPLSAKPAAERGLTAVIDGTIAVSPELMAASLEGDPLLLGVPTDPTTGVAVPGRPASKRPQLPVGFFTVPEGPAAGEYRLEKKTTIGRGADCNIRITDATVSRHHAVVTASEDGFRICDLQSQNGTLVNGEGVTDRPLAENDQILVGDVLLVFHTASKAVRV